MSAKSSITTHTGNVRLNGSATQPEVIIVPGFSEDSAIFARLTDELEARGLPAIAINQPKWQHESLPKNSLTRLGAIVTEITGYFASSEHKVTLVGHSLGAAAVLKAAAERPGEVEGVILFQPAGTTGEMGLGELALRANKKTIKNNTSGLPGLVSSKPDKEGRYVARVDDEPRFSVRRRIAAATIRSGVAIGKNPALAIREANAAGGYNLQEDLARLSEHHIPVHIVGANADEMFDVALFNKHLQSIMPSLDNVSYSQVADSRSPHDDPWIHPARSAEIISQIVKI